MDILAVQAIAASISQGNPGALSVLVSVGQDHPDQFVWFVETCLRKGWLGPVLWVRYKQCNQNISQLLSRAAQEENGQDTQQ
jgi:hypothetical protein